MTVTRRRNFPSSDLFPTFPDIFNSSLSLPNFVIFGTEPGGLNMSSERCVGSWLGRKWDVVLLSRAKGSLKSEDAPVLHGPRSIP